MAKAAELTGKALDWAVAQAEGATNLRFDTIGTWWFTDSKGSHRALSSRWSRAQNWHPSTNWEQAGQIIEREQIAITPDEASREWLAERPFTLHHDDEYHAGPTPLIAAMRAYVARKLGDVVEVPAELLSTEVEA